MILLLSCLMHKSNCIFSIERNNSKLFIVLCASNSVLLYWQYKFLFHAVEMWHFRCGNNNYHDRSFNNFNTHATSSRGTTIMHDLSVKSRELSTSPTNSTPEHSFFNKPFLDISLAILNEICGM